YATDSVTTALAVKNRRWCPLKFMKLKLASISPQILPVKRTPVPYRHYMLASLRVGLFAIAMVVIATVITACSNTQAEAPSPPPELDVAQVVTQSVRQWDEFPGR